MKPCLEIQKVEKVYGEIKALQSINLTLTPGIYGLLGPNGAGKSTLMKIITETIEADTGNLLYCGNEIKKMGNAYRSLLGYMPQQQGIYENFTARRFLHYMAALKEIPKEDAKKEIENVLICVGLEDVAEQKLGTFSGGMKQRILIAQAILGNPEILILDEPTAGLDPKERIRIRNMISQIAKDKIVLIATHVVSDVEFIAKEIIILKNGNVLGCMNQAQWLHGLKEKVFERSVSEEELKCFSEEYLISNIRRDEEERVWIRIILDHSQKISENEWMKVSPTLEDLYLYLFEREGETNAL